MWSRVTLSLLLLALSRGEDQCYYVNDCQGTTSDASCWNCTSRLKVPESNTPIVFRNIYQPTPFKLEYSRVSIENCTHFGLSTDTNLTTLTVEGSDVTISNSIIIGELFVSSSSNLRLSSGTNIHISSSTFQYGATLTFLGATTFDSPTTVLDGFLILGDRLHWTGDLIFSGTIVSESSSVIEGFATWNLRDVQLHSDEPHHLDIQIPTLLANVSQYSSDVKLTLHNATIIGSNMALDHCITCSISDSILSGPNFNPASFNRSTVTFGGKNNFPNGLETHDSFITSINNSSTSGQYFQFRGCTLRGEGHWEADVRSSESASQLVDSVGSTLRLRGRWMILGVRMDYVHVESLANDDEEEYPGRVNDIDRLIIEEIVMREGVATSATRLDENTKYTVNRIFYEISPYPTAAKRYVLLYGGIPMDFPRTVGASSNCDPYTNVTLLTTHNATGFYVQYVPPIPLFRRAYVESDGYLHLSTDATKNDYLQERCTVYATRHTDLKISEENGSPRSLRLITDRNYYTQKLPGEDRCTYKMLMVSSYDLDGQVVHTVNIIVEPSDVVGSVRNLWQNFNDTGSFMTLIRGEDGKIRLSLQWSRQIVENMGSICGFTPATLRFSSGDYRDIESDLKTESILLPPTPAYSDPSCSSYDVPYVSIVYQRGNDRVATDYHRDGLFAEYLTESPPVHFSSESVQLQQKSDHAYTDGTYSYALHGGSYNCTCGDFYLIYSIYHTNGTLYTSGFQRSTYEESYQILYLPYGSFRLYSTGACVTGHSSRSAAFSRTVGRDIELKDPPPDPLRWIIPVSVVGGLVGFVTVAILFIWARRRMIYNRYRLE
ncbi:hypothetical protein PROFUN_10150 [Planoprotostelium fungivorum]|uniref:Uncharacterized protein n=1 Tax=Planoprotostelium fungivorum TaxID=1890364 RepID=A0A2P6NEI9_9EUKA|nr:hypothetical protein PROFUN_10150 [Planoprotostelium fungivorum]